MTKPKIFDCFPFFNETELLELRIKLLYDHVDGFIITEGDLTHSGYPKKFSCLETLKKLQIPQDKITIVHVKLPTVEDNPNNWSRERLQRNAAAEYFQENSVYIVSDCDEIINPDFIPIFAESVINNPNNIYRISLAWLNARADLRVCDPCGNNADFLNPFMCTIDHVQKYSLSMIREDQACELYKLPYSSLFLLDQNKKPVDCGWHFSWMGGTQKMKIKMANCAHSGDPQLGIFQTAVGSVNSKEMINYLESYTPRPGSNDPYGRSDYFLKSYPRELLPKYLENMHHLHNYFFGEIQ
jgi:beta-1,4-mannosyl-glycoprotein beta-1,4-N-acetylglucosaminyltransferase